MLRVGGFSFVIGSPLGGPYSIKGVGKLVGGVIYEPGRAKPRFLGHAGRAGPDPGADKKHLTGASVMTPGGGSNVLATCMSHPAWFP